jgi:hypothetical protein
MKEDLDLYGNELNWMQTFWTIGRCHMGKPMCDMR